MTHILFRVLALPTKNKNLNLVLKIKKTTPRSRFFYFSNLIVKII